MFFVFLAHIKVVDELLGLFRCRDAYIGFKIFVFCLSFMYNDMCQDN